MPVMPVMLVMLVMLVGLVGTVWTGCAWRFIEMIRIEDFVYLFTRGEGSRDNRQYRINKVGLYGKTIFHVLSYRHTLIGRRELGSWAPWLLGLDGEIPSSFIRVPSSEFGFRFPI